MGASSNVTLDGRPLADVLAEEACNEMHEALSDAAPRASRQAGASKYSGNHSGARTSEGAVVYRAGQKWQKVRISGAVFSLAEKGIHGWTLSPDGFFPFGVVVMNEEESEAGCHHCGQGYASVSIHLRHLGINPREHRIRHGIDFKSSLNSTRSLNERRANRKRQISTGLLKQYTFPVSPELVNSRGVASGKARRAIGNNILDKISRFV